MWPSKNHHVFLLWNHSVECINVLAYFFQHTSKLFECISDSAHSWLKPVNVFLAREAYSWYFYLEGFRRPQKARVCMCPWKHWSSSSNTVEFALQVERMHGMLKQSNMHVASPTCWMYTVVKQKYRVIFRWRQTFHTLHFIGYSALRKRRSPSAWPYMLGFAFHKRLVCWAFH